MPFLFTLDGQSDPELSLGGLSNVLNARDALPSTSPHSTQAIDPRSLGIGIVIGVLSTLITICIVFLLSTLRRTSRLVRGACRIHNHSSHNTSSRRHLVRSTTSRITIEDATPTPIVFDNDIVLDIAPIKNESPAVLPSSQFPRHSLRTAHRLPDGYWTHSDASPPDVTTNNDNDTSTHEDFEDRAALESGSSSSTPAWTFPRSRSLQSTLPDFSEGSSTDSSSHHHHGGVVMPRRPRPVSSTPLTQSNANPVTPGQKRGLTKRPSILHHLHTHTPSTSSQNPMGQSPPPPYAGLLE